MMSWIYLHGFASGPNSRKAQMLSDRLAVQNHLLHCPDLNAGDFSHLTLSRQITQVEALLPPPPPATILIGSSFGGLTAAWVGDRQPQVKTLVLLAPAFGFLNHWLPTLGETALQQWQATGYHSVYHYQDATQHPLSYGFVTDLQRYDETKLQRPVRTLILHGQHDAVIPLSASEHYAAVRPWVTLLALDSDHALSNVDNTIWAAIQRFCFDPELSCS